MSVRKAIRPYHQPAGGWGALKALGEHLVEQGVAIKGAATLSRMNQPEGFDCPGCAWPDPKHTSSFEFCENGGKAVAWEATAKRCTPEFFAGHSVTELSGWSDYELEMVGRLTHPMAYDAPSDRYLPVSWDEAFGIIGRHLNALPDPNMADFYTSGRTSNEAAFLYQLFVREYGTNNFPDCSNMCHEATSVGLPRSLGVGKGTLLLEDFDKTDCIFIFGQNPGTNSPRMMTSLRNASRRGAAIISFNPFRERALERFQAPQNPIEMATLSSTQISSRLYQVRVGGDIAVLKGIMKVLVEADDAARAGDQAEVLDWDFIRGHTTGIEALADDLRATQWPDIECQSGLSREDIEHAARVYMKAERAIIVYGMGITQHRCGAHNVRQLANLAPLRGHIGREGAGLCPVRGHSNVQGDRTVGIYRNSDRGISGTAGATVRIQATDRAWPQRRHGARGHGPGGGEDILRHGWQFRGCDTGLADDASGLAKSRSHGPCFDETQPQSSRSRARCRDPAVPRTHGDRCPGERTAVDHRRGFDVDGACVRRSQHARLRTSYERACDRRRRGARHARCPVGRRLGQSRRRLRPHPGCDRGRVPDLPGL